MSPIRDLTSTQQQVLALIATGSTARAAAEAAGIHRNTVANWLCLPEFRQAMSYAQYDKAQFYREQAESLAAESHAAIRGMLADPAVPANVRLKAALAMIDRATAALPALQNATPAAEITEIEHKNAQIPVESAPIRSEPKSPTHASDPPQPGTSAASSPSSGAKTGRNEACPCGSGMKFKRCCLEKTGASALPHATAIAHAE
jgi:preprotein translocase subunit SecA